MTDICEINSLAQLDSLREAWAELLAVTPGADFFRSLPWLEVYWRHYGERQRLRVLVLKEAERPVAIVPLVVRPERTRIGQMNVLTWPLDDWGSFYGPVGPDPQAALGTALSYLADVHRDWDLIELRWMDSDPQADDWVGPLMREASMPAYVRPHAQIPLVAEEDGWEAYWASRTSRHRNNLRRHERRLAEAGELQWVRHRSQPGDSDPHWDLYDACEALSQSTWQADSPDGTTLCHDSIRPFLRDMHLAATAEGCIDLCLLTIDERPIAFSYNYHYHGRVSGLRQGFDSEFARRGAGSVLMCRMIEDNFRRGDHTFDMLPGSLEAKRYWNTRVATSYRFSHVPASLGRTAALRVKRWWDERSFLKSLAVPARAL